MPIGGQAREGKQPMLFRRKKREQERDKAAADNMRRLMSRPSYQNTDPDEVAEQVRSRTDGPTKAAQRQKS